MCLSPEEQTPENLFRIKVYYRNLINTVILSAEGVLVMKKGGNPSGSVNTVTDNTLILYWIMAYAWVKLAPEGDHNLATFENHTSKALLGDDNTWTVSDYGHTFYNGISVIDVWKRIGITTTTDSLKPRLAKDLDFLSAHTVFYMGKAIPIYNRNKLMQSMLYADKGVKPALTLQRACALLQIGWSNISLRNYLEKLIDYLIEKYDKVLSNDHDWIIAKTNIKPPEFYERLFLGETLYLRPQSFIYEEVQERSIKPHKSFTMSSIVLTQNKQKKSKRGNRRARGPRQGKATGRQTKQVIVMNTKPKRKRQNRRNGNPRRVAGNVVEGSFGGAQLLRNPRNMSKPRVEDFDERIGSVNGSINFTTTSFALNPANATTFPWLNKIAQLYERYEFEKLEFYFQHDVSGFAAQGQTGLVYLSALYDASCSAFTSETQICDSDPRVFGMPNENMCLTLARQGMHPKEVPKFCRPGNLPGGADVKEYDAANLFVTTVGQAGLTEVGKLQIKGRVRLYDRILDPSLGAAPANNRLSMFYSAAAPVTTAVSSVIPLAGVLTNALGVVNVAGALILPAGNYVVDLQMQLSATNITDWLMQLTKNGVSQSSQRLTIAVGAGNSVASLNISYYISTAGLDQWAMNFSGSSAFTGAGTIQGFFRILAV